MGGSTVKMWIQLIDRFEVRVAAALSLGAGLIHLTAGPPHLIELGALGLGFYLADIFQIAVAALLLVRSDARPLVWIVIAGNVALIGAWAWSRSVGVPGIPGGPESAGAGDGITVVLQIALIAVLSLRLGGWDLRLIGSRSESVVETFVTASLVAILGVIILSTTIAVVDLTADHGADGDMAPHSAGIGMSAFVGPRD